MALVLAFWALVAIVAGVWKMSVRVTLTKAVSHKSFPSRNHRPAKPELLSSVFKGLRAQLSDSLPHVGECAIQDVPCVFENNTNDQVPIASSRMYLLKDQAAMVTVESVSRPGIRDGRRHVQAASLAQNIRSLLL